MSAPRPHQTGENVFPFPCSPRLAALAERAKTSTEAEARAARVILHPIFAAVCEPFEPKT